MAELGKSVDRVPDDAKKILSGETVWENKKVGVHLSKTSNGDYYISVDKADGKQEHFGPLVAFNFYDTLGNTLDDFKNSNFALFSAKVEGKELQWVFFPLNTKNGALLSPVEGTSVKKSFGYIIVYKEKYMGMHVFSTTGKYLGEFDDFKDFEGQSGHMIGVKDIGSDDTGTLHLVTRFNVSGDIYNQTKERWVNKKVEVLETLR